MTSIITFDLLIPYLTPFKVQEAKAQRIHVPTVPQLAGDGGCRGSWVRLPSPESGCTSDFPAISDGASPDLLLHSPKPAWGIGYHAMGSIFVSDSYCYSHGDCEGAGSCRLFKPTIQGAGRNTGLLQLLVIQEKHFLAHPSPHLSGLDNQTDAQAEG